jgi:hypothetical protein
MLSVIAIQLGFLSNFEYSEYGTLEVLSERLITTVRLAGPDL